MERERPASKHVGFLWLLPPCAPHLLACGCAWSGRALPPTLPSISSQPSLEIGVVLLSHLVRILCSMSEGRPDPPQLPGIKVLESLKKHLLESTESPRYGCGDGNA